MIIMVIPIGILAALISGGFGLAKSGISGLQTAAMRRYNDPTKQLQRLNKAGLPFAAFSAGQAGQQSQLPDLSGLDTAGNSIANYLQSEQGAQSLKLLMEQIKGAGIANEVAGMNRDMLGETYKGAMEQAAGFTDGRTNAKNMYLMDSAIKEADMWMKKNEQTLHALRTGWEETQWRDGKWDALFEEQLRSLASRNALAEQAFSSNEAVATAKAKVMELMEKDGFGIGDALITLFLNAISGRMNVGSGSIGF